MPGKITDLAALTAAAAATTDLIETVDVSDTSMAATGTNKKMSLSDVATFVAANGGGGAVTGTKLSALAALTGANAAGTDVVELLDVSDTTMAASGTNKKVTLTEFMAFLALNYRKQIWYWNSPLNYTAAAVGDENILALSGSPSAMTYTLPSNATAAIPIGAEITVCQGNTGTVTFVAGSGATVNSTGSLKIARQYGVVFAKKTSVNAWSLSGDVEPLVPANTMRGNNTGATDVLLDLTVAQVKTLLAILVASETVVGQVELATAAETLTGTDNTRAVHPAGVIPLANSGPMFGFLFSTTTTAGSSSSSLRLNNATPASATAIYVDYTARSGVDLKTRLLAGTAGDRLYIQDRANSANWRLFELTGAPTDSTTYATLAVVHRSGAGSLWANGASVIAGYTLPPITVGTSAPASPLTNDIWIDTT